MVRGATFTHQETMVLLDIIERDLPIGNEDWEAVEAQHYHEMERILGAT